MAAAAEASVAAEAEAATADEAEVAAEPAAPANAGSSDVSQSSSSTAVEAQFETLVEMGFTLDKVSRAREACDHDPERTLNHLLDCANNLQSVEREANSTGTIDLTQDDGSMPVTKVADSSATSSDVSSDEGVSARAPPLQSKRQRKQPAAAPRKQHRPVAAPPAAAASNGDIGDDNDETQPLSSRAKRPTEAPPQPAKRPANSAVVNGGTRQGKQPVRTELPQRGTDSCSSLPSRQHATYQVGDWVQSCYYPDEIGRQPKVHKPPWFDAEVRAVSADQGTVDVLYAIDSVAVLRVPIQHVKPAQRPADDVNPLHEMALIEKVRAVTIARNREMIEELMKGVRIDMRAQRPKAMLRKKAASVPLAPRRQPSRGRAPDPLDEYQLGFDFGYANALMAYQSNDIFDVLIAAYGETVANQVVARYMVEGGGSGDGTGCNGSSSSSSSAGVGSSSGLGSGDDVGVSSSSSSDAAVSIVVFARLGVRVVGAALMRVHPSPNLGTRLFEVPFVAVAYGGHGISEALRAYVDVVAENFAGIADAAPWLLIWRSAASPTDDPDLSVGGEPLLLADLKAYGHVLSVPPHLHCGGELIKISEVPHGAMRELRLQRARSMQMLVKANEAASEAAKAAAAGLLQRAESMVADDLVGMIPVDANGRLELPDADPCGSYVALWHGLDAMFTLARINERTMKLFDVSRTASGRAGAAERGRQEVDIGIDVTPFDWDNEQAELQPVPQGEPLHAHELQCSSLVWASDREATIRSGMAIDMHGDSLKVCRPYHVIAALPGTPAFVRQLTEVLAVIHSFADFGPELPTYYLGGHNMPGEWPTDSEMVLKRAVRMADKFTTPPSSRDAWPSPRKMGESSSSEPKGWRCKTWEEVRLRCGSLHILCQDDDDQINGGDGDAGGSKKKKGKKRTSTDKEVTEPCTRPRTLELYCGRASLSAHHQRRGAHAWFVDWDREVVEKSFAKTPEYFDLDDAFGNGGRVHCVNGLDERRFIHLDFLDLAMALLKSVVDVGHLHAIHDGLDCTTFTPMAKSNHERDPENFFAGTSEKAFITNVRQHFLVAFHLRLHQNGQTKHCCRTAENPADNARRQYHPLTTNVLEAPKRDGGLGMVKSWLSYCQLIAGYQKHTNIWADLVQVHEQFYSPDQGIMKLHCCPERPCNLFDSHKQVRPGRNDPGRADRGSIYPDELCQLLAGAMTRLFGVVRTLKLDAANTDGWEDACARCGNRASRSKGKFHDCWKCEKCPQVYCSGCIPHELRPTQCDKCKAQRKAQDKGKPFDDSRCDCPDWICPECVLAGR